MQFGKLYIVATPIGNLEDITLRAIKILSEVDIILAEDTRVTRKLIDFISSHHLPSTDHQPMTKAKLLSYHQHSSEAKELLILKNLIEGKNIALVTDSGTPGVSDPGNKLIGYVLEKEPLIQIVPIPGPSSLTAALSISGFNVTRFIFAGFMPKKAKRKLFTQVKNSKLPLVFFESPNRILKTLDKLLSEFGNDKKIFIARELTKIHETLYRGTISEVKKRLGKEKVRGEIVVVLEGGN